MELTANAATWLGALVSLLVTALFIHFGAKLMVPGKVHYMQGIATAFFGSLLAGFVLFLTGFGTLGNILALASWALVAAIAYRTSWLRGALVGLVAWLIWLVVNWIIQTTLIANV